MPLRRASSRVRWYKPMHERRIFLCPNRCSNRGFYRRFHPLIGAVPRRRSKSPGCSPSPLSLSHCGLWSAWCRSRWGITCTSFSPFFVNALGSAIYGPLLGLISGFSADLLGFILQPTGPFFPGYLLSSMLGSFFYGLFFYRARINGVRVLLAKLVVNLGVNVGLGALWSAMLYGKGYYYYLVKSLVKNIGLLPIETVLLFLFFKAILPAASRAGLLPEQKKIRLW